MPAEVTNRTDPTVSDKTQQIEKAIVHSVNPPVTNPFPEQTQNLQLEYQLVQMSSTETNKILINRTPIQNESVSNPDYVSPSDILPVGLPQASPRKSFAQQKNNKKISCYHFDTRKKTPCRKFSSFGQETIKKT